MRPFDFLWAVSTKNSYWVTLLWSASRCVYFVRPNTLLLCIFLFCIFLLYRTDPQVEVQIRILPKDKYVKLCQNLNTGNHTMIFCTQFLRKNLIGFLYFTETTCSNCVKNVNTGNHTLIPEHRFKENFYLGFFIKEKQLASQVVFLVKSKHWVLAIIQVFLCLCFF